MNADIKITRGYRPGCIGRIAELHSTYYHEHWQFGLFFEAKVASELSEFLRRYQDYRDGIWLASINDRIHGSIVIDGMHAKTDGAHLRWFIVSDEWRGKGIGHQLIDVAKKFCLEKKFERIYLWTFAGLLAARHLYEKAGFVLKEQKQGQQWGKLVEEQRFEFTLEYQ